MPDNLGAAGASKLPLPIRHRPSEMSSPNKPRRQHSPSKAATTTPRRSLSQPPKAQADDGHTTTNTTSNDPSTARTPVTNHNHNNNNFRASAPPVANARFSIRTPGSQVADFRASSRHLLLSASAKRYAVPTQFTPHGRAAIRALDLRRAAINDINTPGRNRRRSMRDQRETPRDVLRALSKTLAPTSKRVSTSSSSSPDDPGGNNNTRRRRGGTSERNRSRSRGRRGAAAVVIPEDPDDSDEFPIDRPRFSLPIDEDADSDGDLPRPPRSSGLEDLEDNYTMQSIEMPRRATLGQGPQPPRYSIRMSDYGPLNDPQSDNDDDGDSAFFPRLNWADDAGDDGTGGIGGGGQDDEDATIERLEDEAARRDTLGGRISDFGAIDFDLEAADQSTVVLAPQVQSSPARGGLSSPTREDLSPENEPFGFDDGPPPPGVDDDDDEMDMDIGGGAGGEETLPDFTAALDDDDDQEDIRSADHSTETVVTRQASRASEARVSNNNNSNKRKKNKVSRHGVPYPSLPAGVVKRLAQRFAGRAKLGPDALAAVAQASDWFFEQLGDDLEAYARHAGRETINESDMLTLMRRQRQTSSAATPFALAQRHLPRELLQEIKMPAPAPLKKTRRRRKQAAARTEQEEDEE